MSAPFVTGSVGGWDDERPSAGIAQKKNDDKGANLRRGFAFLAVITTSGYAQQIADFRQSATHLLVVSSVFRGVRLVYRGTAVSPVGEADHNPGRDLYMDGQFVDIAVTRSHPSHHLVARGRTPGNAPLLGMREASREICPNAGRDYPVDGHRGVA